MTPAWLRLPVAALGWISIISPVAGATSLASLAADRAAVERVYYNHRLGTKPPFEELLPPAEVEKLVRIDLKKEAILAKRYGVRVTAADVQAEVSRIDATTQAPDILAELKAALGNDPKRFAETVARPGLVERKLRAAFENDDQLHTQPRRAAEKLRGRVMAAAKTEQRIALLRDAADAIFSEAAWQLSAPDLVEHGESTGVNPGRTVPARSASYSVEAAATRATPATDVQAEVTEPHFADLSPELQRVLRVQLRKAGDVTAVIETPGGFLVFVARDVSPSSVRVATATFPKRDYDTWVAEQPD